jgi:hypothetical protein
LAQELEKSCKDQSPLISPEYVRQLAERARNAEALLKGHYALP